MTISDSRTAASMPVDVALGYWRLALDMWTVTTQAQMVIAVRTTDMMGGMLGMWPARPREMQRMVAEKPVAFARSAEAAVAAMRQLDRPDEIAVAALKPLKQKTRSNVTRLVKSGPRM